jgi:hypothetical protein
MNNIRSHWRFAVSPWAFQLTRYLNYSFLLCCPCALWDHIYRIWYNKASTPRGLGLMDALQLVVGSIGWTLNLGSETPARSNGNFHCFIKLVACWGDDQSVLHPRLMWEVAVVNKICLDQKPWRWMKPQNTKSGLCHNTPIFTIFQKCNNKQHVVDHHPVPPHSENKGQNKNKIQNPFVTHERWKARCNSTYKSWVTNSWVWWASLCIHGSEASNMFLVAVEQAFLFTTS